jgi:hypothetical protein
MNSIRVLHVDNVAAFWTRMSRNYRYKYETLQRHPAFTCVDIRDAAATAEREHFDVLIVGVFGTHPDGNFWCPLSALHSIPHRGLVVEDLREGSMYGGIRGLCDCVEQHFHHFISTYDCDALHEIVRQCPTLNGVSFLPHHVNTSIFMDQSLNKTVDVLLYGNVDRPYYSFRRRLYSLILDRIPNVQRVVHPTYRHFDPECCGEGLARLINQSRIAVATSTDDDYLVAKYFEISACGTVLAGSMPAQGRPIWGDDYVRLDEMMSDDEIVDRLRDALADLPAHQQAARRVCERVHRQWSVERYPERLLRIAERICDEDTAAPARAAPGGA